MRRYRTPKFSRRQGNKPRGSQFSCASRSGSVPLQVPGDLAQACRRKGLLAPRRHAARWGDRTQSSPSCRDGCRPGIRVLYGGQGLTQRSPERRRGIWPEDAPGNLVTPPRCHRQPGNGDDKAQPSNPRRAASLTRRGFFVGPSLPSRPGTRGLLADPAGLLLPPCPLELVAPFAPARSSSPGWVCFSASHRRPRWRRLIE